MPLDRIPLVLEEVGRGFFCELICHFVRRLPLLLLWYVRPMTHARKAINVPDGPPAAGPYSHAVSANGFLFLSGQIGSDPVSGRLVGETAAEQASRCLENLKIVAEGAGASLSDAVRMTVYLIDMAEFAEVNAVYERFFPADPPARVTFGVAGLPAGAAVEIDAVIALSD
jgi:2-iminobutanoate/2-iminopropanoate deaminase